MPGTSREASDDELTTGRTLLGLVALVAAERDDQAEERRPARSEYVLADAGFTHGEIARLTGKKAEAVRSTLRRRDGKAAKS